MPEKSDNFQLELFSQSEDSNNLKKQPADVSFLSFIWSYERAILIIIGIVTMSIISYSLGVERGRQLSVLRSNSRLDIAALKTQAPAHKPIIKREPVQAQFRDKEIFVPKESQQQSYAYIIQLASYKTRAYAQKEAQILKSKGFTPIILSKGNYIILCIGNFPKKEIAESILSGLKKQYSGCYIRRL